MTPHAVSFTVLGIAQPKGSMKSFGWHRKDASGAPMYRDGKPVIGSAATSDNPNLKGWETSVRTAAQQQCGGVFFDDAAVRIAMVFLLPRPVSLPRRITHHTKRPDLDKLARAVKDALKGVLWRDDSQVIDLVARKGYATGQPQARIVVDYAQAIDDRAIEQDLFATSDLFALAPLE